MKDISIIWKRLKRLEGEHFVTKTGLPFTYEISGNSLTPSRTKYNIGIRDFENALKEMPLRGPGEINDIVRGPAYVWALLNDERVNKDG